MRNSQGRAVGRIAAFYNLAHAQREEQPTGGCGFFESIESLEVSALLLDTAREWLMGCGMEAMDGPINFGQRDSWWGLLVQGFDSAPLYENPYNPPYYRRLFEEYGFRNYFNQNTYIWLIDSDRVSPRVEERTQRLRQSGEYSFRSIRGQRLEQVAREFRQIYNRAWRLFPGVEPLTEQQASDIMEKMRPIIDRDIIFFAYHHNCAIGFFIMLPDLNRLIGDFQGSFGLWQRLQLIWRLKVTRQCDRIFGLIFGIDPAYHGKGIESGMMSAILEQYISTKRNSYRSIEFAWIGDFNPVMNRMILNYVCARPHKMHATYRYLFDRTREFHRCPPLAMSRERLTSKKTGSVESNNR